MGIFFNVLQHLPFTPYFSHFTPFIFYFLSNPFALCPITDYDYLSIIMAKLFLQAKLSFLSQWLLHAFVLWLGLTLLDALSYLYKLQLYGAYLTNPDGSQVSLWQRFLNHNSQQAIGVGILFISLLTELSYHYVFVKKPLLFFICTCLICGIVSSFFVVTFKEWKFGVDPSVPFNFIEPALLIALYTALYAVVRDFFYRRMELLEKNYEHSKAALQALKAGVHPHFFFNTLNSVYGTALQEKAILTAQSLEQLSEMMRYVMQEATEDFTTIAQEISFIEDYLQLQRLRIPQRDNIRIEVAISYDGKSALIAPLLLIPFVENAFKYGISLELPCYIYLHLKVADTTLEMVLENRLLPSHGFQKGEGTGIATAVERLKLIYPKAHQLEIKQQEDRFKVDLWIQLHTQSFN